jgi:hypothetical protein
MLAPTRTFQPEERDAGTVRRFHCVTADHRREGVGRVDKSRGTLLQQVLCKAVNAAKAPYPNTSRR